MKINIIIARETALRLARQGICEILKKVLAVTLTDGIMRLVKSNPMPNAHAADKESLSFYIPRTLAVRIKKAAKARGETMTEFLTNLFTNATNHIELTAEDYRAIAQATELAAKKRERRSTLNPRSKGASRKNRESGPR